MSQTPTIEQIVQQAANKGVVEPEIENLPANVANVLRSMIAGERTTQTLSSHDLVELGKIIARWDPPGGRLRLGYGTLWMTHTPETRPKLSEALGEQVGLSPRKAAQVEAILQWPIGFTREDLIHWGQLSDEELDAVCIFIGREYGFNTTIRPIRATPPPEHKKHKMRQPPTIEQIVQQATDKGIVEPEIENLPANVSNALRSMIAGERTTQTLSSHDLVELGEIIARWDPPGGRMRLGYGTPWMTHTPETRPKLSEALVEQVNLSPRKAAQIEAILQWPIGFTREDLIHWGQLSDEELDAVRIFIAHEYGFYTTGTRYAAP